MKRRVRLATLKGSCWWWPAGGLVEMLKQVKKRGPLVIRRKRPELRTGPSQ